MEKVQIGRSSISGRGVFAVRTISRGERVIQMTGKRVRGTEFVRLYREGKVRWDDPLEIGKDRYLILDGVPLRINHSCNPSCGIRGVNTLYALRNLKKGDEITFDYSTVVGRNEEGEEDWLMRCRCGAKTCRKRIGNWLTLPKGRLRYFIRNQALPNFILKQTKE